MTRRDDCWVIVRQLWPALDGALPAAWQRRVARHLEECAACRSHFDFEREFVTAVRRAGLELGLDGDRLRNRVLDALAGQGFRPVSP